MMHPTTTNTSASRLHALAAHLLPNAPGLTSRDNSWNDAAFFGWMKDNFTHLSDGDQECARLVAALAQHDLLLEDIGQFDLINALRSTSGAQHAALRSYLADPWTP